MFFLWEYDSSLLTYVPYQAHLAPTLSSVNPHLGAFPNNSGGQAGPSLGSL